MNRLFIATFLSILLLCSGKIHAGQTPAKDTSMPTTPPTSTKTGSASGNTASQPSTSASAETNTPPDDEFNIFLLILAVAFCSLIVGAVIVGSLATALILLFLLGLVSAGILSTAVFVGLYKRSLSAGFKTLLAILCSLGGIVAGSLAMLLITRLFRLNMTHAASIVSGAAAGLIGGLLLGMSVSFLIRRFSNYIGKNFSFN